MSRPRMATLAAGLMLGALLLAPFASSLPDGLETVAERLGLAFRATQPMQAPLAEYAVPWLGGPPLGTLVAGAAGALAVFVLVGLAGLAIRLGRQGRRECLPHPGACEQTQQGKRGPVDASEGL